MLFKHAPVSIKVLLSTVDWDIDCMNEIFRCCFFLFFFFFVVFLFTYFASPTGLQSFKTLFSRFPKERVILKYKSKAQF